MKGLEHHYAVHEQKKLKKKMRNNENHVASMIAVDHRTLGLSIDSQEKLSISKLRDLNSRLAVGPSRDDLTVDERRLYQSIRDTIAEKQAEYDDEHTGVGINVVKWAEWQHEAEEFDRAFEEWGTASSTELGIAAFERDDVSVIAPFGNTFITIREGDEDPYISMIRTDTKKSSLEAMAVSGEEDFLPKTTPQGISDTREFFDSVRKDQLEKRMDGNPLRETLCEMRGDIEAEVDALLRRGIVQKYAKEVLDRGII
eukprot:g4290.t1